MSEGISRSNELRERLSSCMSSPFLWRLRHRVWGRAVLFDDGLHSLLASASVLLWQLLPPSFPGIRT